MQSINSRIERIPDNGYNKKLLGQTGIGYLFDALDGTMLSFTLPVITALWALTSHQTGILASSLFVGYLFGTAFSGYLGDRFGRKNVIMWTLVIYCVATMVSALATNWEFFFWARVVAGFGTGGEAAIMAPYLAELISSKYRGRYTSLLTGFFPLGHISAAALSYFIIPVSDNGWRIALVITALPIFMFIIWRRTLPESPLWLESKGRYKEADEAMTRIELAAENSLKYKLPKPEKNASAPSIIEEKKFKKDSFLTLFSKKYIKRTIMLWIVWFSLIYTNFGFLTWLPSLLVNQGYEIASSFIFSLLIYISQIPGYLTGAVLNDKLGRKPVLLLGMAGATIAALCMANFGNSAATIITFGGLMSMFMSIGYSVLYTYTPEQFPTSIRATGMGATSAFSRVGGILAPIVIGYIYPLYGFSGVFIMITTILIIGTLTVMILGQETKAKSLEEVEIDDKEITDSTLKGNDRDKTISK